MKHKLLRKSWKKVGIEEEEGTEEKSFYKHPASHRKQGHAIFVFAFWTRSSHRFFEYPFWCLETRSVLTRNKRESEWNVFMLRSPFRGTRT